MGDKKVARSFHVQHYEHRIRLNYHANIGDAKRSVPSKGGYVTCTCTCAYELWMGTFQILGESEDATLEDRGTHAPQNIPAHSRVCGFRGRVEGGIYLIFNYFEYISKSAGFRP